MKIKMVIGHCLKRNAHILESLRKDLAINFFGQYHSMFDDADDLNRKVYVDFAYFIKIRTQDDLRLIEEIEKKYKALLLSLSVVESNGSDFAESTF